MKKHLAFAMVVILILTMIFILTSCSGNEIVPEVTPTPTPEATPELTPEPTPEPEPEPEPKPEPEPEPEAELEAISVNRLQRGSWSGNVYSSEYLGFRLTVPDKWKWSMEVRSDDYLYSWRELPEDVLDAILNGEIPKEYWLTQPSFYELSVSSELTNLYYLPAITVIITPLYDSYTSFDEFFQSEAARTGYIFSDEKIEIGNFRWYETVDVSEPEFQLPVFTPPSCAPGGGMLTTTLSVRTLHTVDVDNGVYINILIIVVCFCGDEGVLEDSNEILSWFTPYP